MKKILVVLLLIVCVFAFAGCAQVKTGNRIVSGKDVQTFTYAYIRLGDKIEEGYVTQWRDYDNSDTVQVMVNGKFYLTHYTNVVLVADPSQGALSYTDPSIFSNE